jgi:hypothetical protein
MVSVFSPQPWRRPEWRLPAVVALLLLAVSPVPARSPGEAASGQSQPSAGIVEPTAYANVTRTVVMQPADCKDHKSTRTAEMSGQWVYLDKDGKPTTPPPGTVPPAPAAKASPGTIKVQKSTIPGGGYIADLNGQYQMSSVATIGPDGKVQVDCVPATAASGSADPKTSHAACDGKD